MNTPTRFDVTYEIVTPESAEDGDAAERGYEAEGVTLRDAVSAARAGLGGYEDGGRWFTTTDTEPDYRTGEYTTYAIHPPNTITPSSYARLSRLLTRRVTRRPFTR